MNLKEQYLFFWLDELEFTIENHDWTNMYDEDTWLLPEWNINDSNTDSAYIKLWWLDFYYDHFKPKGYSDWLKFRTVIDKIPVSTFAILKGRENVWIWHKTKDKVVFYSSFFVLEKSWKLPFTLNEFYQAYLENKNNQLRRMDVALDVPYTVKEVNTYIFPMVNFFSQIWQDKKNPLFSQTYYIKNPRTDWNRKYIFRIYDKILDTWKKKKWFLYPHLENNNDVRRIELELRSEECKRIIQFSISDILDNKYKSVQRIFTKFFSKHTNLKLSYEDIELKAYTNEKFDLKTHFLQHWHIPEDYVSRSHGYIKNIKINTGYTGLFQVILWVKYDEEQPIRDFATSYEYEICKKHWLYKATPKNRNIFDWYTLLEELIKYLIKQKLRQSLLNKIIKKYITTPKLKLTKKKPTNNT